jgi:ankyrin repeat protein
MAATSLPLTEEDYIEFLESARFGDLEDVAELLVAGAPVAFADEGGNTALHKAAANGHVDIAKLLVEHGATFLPNGSGNTPLHWAALNGQTAMVDYLVKTFEDIDVFAKNSFNKSAFTEAINAGHEDIARIILSHRSVDDAMGKLGSSGTSGSGAEEGAEEVEEGDLAEEDEDIFDESAAPEADDTETAGGAGAVIF